jgi:peptide/nickel transport system substrate-binding protein
MKNKVIWLGLSFLVAAATLVASCGTSTTTPTTNVTTTASTTNVSTTVPTTITSSAVSTTTPSTATTVVATTTSTGNWWDSLGTPQYGGTLTLAVDADPNQFDVYSVGGAMNVINDFQEKLFGDQWTLDPSLFNYGIDFRPLNYVGPNIASSWEYTNPHTLVVNLRHDVYWQNLPPVNGRQFTSADVLYHFARDFGVTANGWSNTGSPLYSTVVAYQDMQSVTAPDKYTVVFAFNTYYPEFIGETLTTISTSLDMEPQEVVTAYGNLNNWHNAIGTGPWIISDYVGASSVSFTKNPNYWAHDERYPQNQLPYVSALNVLVIPSQPTILAAVRAGKVDYADGLSLMAAQGMAKTNPEILQVATPGTACETIDPRNDIAPFNDIRVREAMQQAIDLATINSTYYGGTSLPYPSSLTSVYMTGYACPYQQWPATLQATYAYNPTNAKTLLAAAGYPNGFTTTLVVDSATTDMSLMQIVQSYFAAVGINVNIQTMDNVSMINYLAAGANKTLINDGVGGGALGLSYQPSRQINRNATATTVNNYCFGFDPQIQTDYNASSTAPDTATVESLMVDVNKVVANDHFVISLLIPMNFCVYQPWLHGYNGQDRCMSGQATPLMGGWYTARFWLTKN